MNANPLVAIAEIAKDVSEERARVEECSTAIQQHRAIVVGLADLVRGIYPTLPDDGLVPDVGFEVADLAGFLEGSPDSIAERLNKTHDELGALLDDARDLAEYTTTLIEALGDSMGLGEDDHAARRCAERIARALPVGVDK